MITGVIAHLWQSTLFAGVAWLVALMLRRNRAQDRYWVWFTASAKFLVPFSLMVQFGTVMPHRASAPMTGTEWLDTATEFSRPLGLSTAAINPHGAASFTASSYLQAALFALWACGVAALLICWLFRWRHVRTLLKSARPVSIRTALEIRVPVMSAPDLIEPGVIGVLRPVLLLPDGIARRFTQAQMDAILAHELCHIGRKDNLTAAIHMAVQAIFWFHPVTWWIGARLVDERERACDEEVLSRGCAPGVYAETILEVCKSYFSAPLACVSGVTGSDLKHRIETIMNNRIAVRLSLARKAILAAAGIAALAVPVAIGVVNAPSIRAQSIILGSKGQPRPSFEVVSVKPIDRATMHRDHEGARLDRERFIDRTDLLQFIVHAYIKDGSCTVKAALGEACPLIAGSLPTWARTDRFEILAKLPANSPPSYTSRQIRNNETPELDLMLQVLLEDRFHLKVHRETREIPVFALTVGKNGPKLKRAALPEQRKGPDGTPLEVHGLEGINQVTTQDGAVRNRLHFQGSSMKEAAESLGRFFDRPVLDQTGLAGEYDFTLEYDVEQSAPEPVTADRTSGLGGNFVNPYTGLTSSALSIALQEVGLKLESTKAPVEVLVIDHVEKPSEN